MSNYDSYNSLYWHKLSGQIYSSPILGEPAIPQSEAKLPYQLGVHLYMTPPTHTQPTVRLESPNSPPVNSVHSPPYVPTQRLLTRKRTIDRMVNRYIVFEHLEKSSLEHTRTSYSRQFLARTASSHTRHQPEHRNILAKSMPKIDQHAKLNITVNK